MTLTNPQEKFTCPRDLQPAPETYHIADPLHPTQKDIDAIPVNFPGVDRTLLVAIALKDPCVIEFLKSGGNIEGITDQPRPFLNSTETVTMAPGIVGLSSYQLVPTCSSFSISIQKRGISVISELSCNSDFCKNLTGET